MNNLTGLLKRLEIVHNQLIKLYTLELTYNRMKQIKQLESQYYTISNQIQAIQYNDYYNKNEYKLSLDTTQEVNNTQTIEFQLKELIGYIPYN